MSKSAAILGLAAIAYAQVAYPDPSQSAVVPSTSSYPAESTPSVYPSQSASQSSIPVYPSQSGSPSSTYDPVGYPSGSPSGSPSYYPSSSSSYDPSAYYGSTTAYTPSSSSYYPSATPTFPCWTQCFAENAIESESELCGNTAVDQCIQDTCDCEDDKAYWAWYLSYCPAPSSSIVAPTPTPSAPASDCWGTCFAEAGIVSESELCGNTAVDQCIHDTCSCEEDSAYWQWYNSYCPVTTTASVTIPTYTTTASATPTADCWSACFAEYDVTSEAELCGDDQVSACIYETCSPALDKAYWEWYDGYCAPASSSIYTVSTYTTAIVYSSPVVYTTDGYPTTVTEATPTAYVYSTTVYPASPYSTATETGLPSPPGYSAGATQTGAYAPAQSTWSPVPATGAGASNKPSFVLAAALALAAFF